MQDHDAMICFVVGQETAHAPFIAVAGAPEDPLDAHDHMRGSLDDPDAAGRWPFVLAPGQLSGDRGSEPLLLFVRSRVRFGCGRCPIWAMKRAYPPCPIHAGSTRRPRPP